MFIHGDIQGNQSMAHHLAPADKYFRDPISHFNSSGIMELQHYKLHCANFRSRSANTHWSWCVFILSAIIVWMYEVGAVDRVSVSIIGFPMGFWYESALGWVGIVQRRARCTVPLVSQYHLLSRKKCWNVLNRRPPSV